MTPDHGKVRVYRCVCGGVVVRTLRGAPRPCERCDTPLDGLPYAVEDHLLFVRRLLAWAGAGGGGPMP